MAAIYLREQKASDFERLYALDVLCFRPPFRFSRSMMAEVLSAITAIVPVACRRREDGAEEILGFCACTVHIREEGMVAYVATLDVHPQERRAGLARRLMQAAEDGCRARGARCLLLHVFEGNHAARTLYATLGYRELQCVAGFYGRGRTALLLGKTLVTEDGPSAG